MNRETPWMIGSFICIILILIVVLVGDRQSSKTTTPASTPTPSLYCQKLLTWNQAKS